MVPIPCPYAELPINRAKQKTRLNCRCIATSPWIDVNRCSNWERTPSSDARVAGTGYILSNTSGPRFCRPGKHNREGFDVQQESIGKYDLAIRADRLRLPTG